MFARVKNLSVLVLGLTLGMMCLSSFAATGDAFPIKATAAKGGLIEPSGKVKVASGGEQAFRIAPINPADYEISDVMVDGASQGAITEYKFTGVSGKHSIAAKFKKRVYDITLTNNSPANGKLVPVKNRKATYGKKIKVLAKPAAGYAARIYVDGKLVAKGKTGKPLKYKLTVTGNHSIQTWFSAVDKIVVTPTSALLASNGGTQQLTAQAFNAEGLPVSAIINWTSSHNDQISTDKNGLIASQVRNGSATITASVDDISAVPVVALTTALPADAVTVADNQTVGDPALVDPSVPLSLGLQYQVTLLAGTPAPAVDSILIGTGEKPIAGKVVAVETLPNGDLLVTLEMVTIDQVFPELVFDENIDLSNVEPEIPDAILADFDISYDADGSMVFTPKESASGATSKLALPNSVLDVLGKFKCEGTGSLASFTPSNPSIKIKNSLSYAVGYNSSIGGFQYALVRGSLGGEIASKTEFNVAAAGGVECKLRVGQLRIPFPGPLAFFMGGRIPYGMGVGADIDIPVGGFGFQLKSSAGFTVTMGVSCPGGADCVGVKEVNPDTCSDCGITPILPEELSLKANMEISPFVFANFIVGSDVLFENGFIQLVEGKGGKKFKASVASPATQMDDTAYKSEYNLSRFGTVNADTGSLNRVLSVVKINPIVGFSAELNNELGRSPDATEITVDKDSYKKGDKLNFHVTLDPFSINFIPLFFNVGEVQIFRKGEITPIAKAKGVPGQTEYSLAWKATDSGDSKGNFYAFVNTKLMPVPLIGSLELGVALSGDRCPENIDIWAFTEIDELTTECLVYYPSGRLQAHGYFQEGHLVKLEMYYDNAANSLSDSNLYSPQQNPDESWVSVLDGVEVHYYVSGNIAWKDFHVKYQKSDGTWQTDGRTLTRIEDYYDNPANSLERVALIAVEKNPDGRGVSVLDGVEVHYYVSGNIAWKTFHVKYQKSDGIWQMDARTFTRIEHYYDNAANSLYETKLYAVEKNPDGLGVSVLDGVAVGYNESGNIAWKIFHVKYQKSDGTWQTTGGTYTRIEGYYDNATNSLYETNLYAVVQEIDGRWRSVEDGISKSFYENGKLYTVTTYSLGVLVAYVKYDTDGSILETYP